MQQQDVLFAVIHKACVNFMHHSCDSRSWFVFITVFYYLKGSLFCLKIFILFGFNIKAFYSHDKSNYYYLKEFKTSWCSESLFKNI